MIRAVDPASLRDESDASGLAEADLLLLLRACALMLAAMCCADHHAKILVQCVILQPPAGLAIKLSAGPRQLNGW